MDINLVATLATAGASLDAASECVESGSAEWELILGARRLVERLVQHEVNDSWSDAPQIKPQGDITLAADMAHPMQPVGWDGKGVIRFKRNAIVDAVMDDCRERGGLDLNKIAVKVALREFKNEDMVQLAQLIGYSVSGFGDLNYVPEDALDVAEAEADRIASLKGEADDASA